LHFFLPAYLAGRSLLDVALENIAATGCAKNRQPGNIGATSVIPENSAEATHTGARALC